MSTQALVCTPKSLPRNLLVSAANRARDLNPMNSPSIEGLARTVRPEDSLERIAVLTTKYWKKNGVRLTVGFLDNPPQDLRKRILSHMNAWGKTANVKFVETNTDPEVRISRVEDGYWSYLGTDILSISGNEQTMNLQGFTMQTPDSEFYRVVRHETGHTLGFPHEHMRRELIQRIDPQKAYPYFRLTQGWKKVEVNRQVLTPIEESSLWGTPNPDPNSIMCYQIPGTITFDGEPIPGGLDISQLDYEFIAKVYPKP